MTPRRRSQDLTADLLHDLEQEEAAPPAAAPAPPPAEPEPAPFVETALYLSPRAWRLPSVSRAGRSLSISAGPLRFKVRR